MCALCAAGLNRFDAAWSFGYYEGALRELLHLLKYEGVTPVAARLGGALSRAVPRDTAFDAIVPMPLHWWRRWRRGFNQAELLADEVARRLGLPLEKPVKRRRLTGSQTGLTAGARRRNVAGAFRVLKPERVAGKRLLLVDDVLTTGATANACAAALKSAGARYVAVLTLARADRRARVEIYRPDSDGGITRVILPAPGVSI
jgi:ComF family protein